MASVRENSTIKDYQDFTRQVYGLPNDRHFSLWDMISNLERFVMRGLKGIRKKDPEKTSLNLLVALTWFISIMNRLQIDLEEVTWQRFPYLCSYCGACPCQCKAKKVQKRQQVKIDESKRVKAIIDFQEMFNRIYPAGQRTLEDAGIHLAEEVGEFSEAVLTYRGAHQEKDFHKIELEAADLLSCFMGVFSSLDLSMAKKLSLMFSENCHVCKKLPCTCQFLDITKFKS